MLMDTYFEYKHRFRGVQFCYTRKPGIDEREIHTYHEILYYLDGDATLICKDFTQPLHPDTLILIPRESYHFFKSDSPSRFERLKISFNEIEGFEDFIAQEMGEIRIMDHPDEILLSLLRQVCRELKEGDSESRLSSLLMGTLLLLLSLSRHGEHAEQIKRTKLRHSRLISDVIDHIDSDPAGATNTAAIAAAVNVSPSTLSHSFKEEMGVSLHRYVSEKRMSLAKRLIEEGSPPTKIFSECGYSDYSSFYKAFVKRYGRPPSAKEDEHA